MFSENGSFQSSDDEVSAVTVPDRLARLERRDVIRDAAIARIAKDVKDLQDSQKVQLDILSRLDKLATGAVANPTVRAIATAIGAAILSWLASRGVK